MISVCVTRPMSDKSLQSMSHLAVSSPQYRPRRHNLLHTNSTSSLNGPQRQTRVRPRPRPQTLEVTVEKSKSNFFHVSHKTSGIPSSTLSDHEGGKNASLPAACFIGGVFPLKCTKILYKNYFCIMLQNFNWIL